MSEVADSRDGGASLSGELERLVPDVGEQPAEAGVFLVGLSGGNAGKLFKVPLGESFLGRSSKSIVTFDEKAISQRHGRLVLDGGRCVLTDLGSTNGIYVNESRIHEPVQLAPGDVIRMGRTSLGFLSDGAGDAQTSALTRSNTSRFQFDGRTGALPVLARPTAASVVDVSGSELNGLDVALDRAALIWGVVRTYRRPLLVGLLCGAVLGAASVAIKPPPAKAEFQIFLKHLGLEQSQGRYTAAGAEYFRFASKNFTAPELVRQTMKSFGLPVDDPVLSGKIGSDLGLRPEDQSIYVGTFYHTDADFAERFLATHLQNYLEREIGKSIRVLSSEVALLRKQYDENAAEMKRLQGEMKEFKEKHLAGLPEHAAGQLEARAELQNRAVELRAALERYKQEYALGRRQYADGNALVATRVDRASSYGDALAKVRQKIASMKASGYKEESSEVRALRAEESLLNEQQQHDVTAATSETDRQANREHTALGDRVDRLGVDVASTQTELDLVLGRLGEIDKIAATLPAVEAKFTALSDAMTQGQSLQQHLYEQLKAKELKLEFERASVAGRYEIVEPPSATPAKPVAVAAQRGAVAGLLGLVIAVVGSALHWLNTYAKGRRRPSASSQALMRV
ncbi:MAG TPA: FHA domain-containing protein [Polyangiaceae bacterium]|nr:FHA domain-containing protein [Polyangiaceae bacterium]